MIKFILKSNKFNKNQNININHCGEVCEDCRGRGHNMRDLECASCNSKGTI